MKRTLLSLNAFLALLVLATVAFMTVLFHRVNTRNRTVLADADPVAAPSAIPQHRSPPVVHRPANVPPTAPAAVLSAAIALEESCTPPIEALAIEPRMLNPRNLVPPRPRRDAGHIWVTRISNAWPDDLRRELGQFLEVGLNEDACTAFYKEILDDGKSGPPSPKGHLASDCGQNHLAEMARKHQVPHLSMLPWRKGADCELDRSTATNLQNLSRCLRGIMTLAAEAERASRADFAWRREMLKSYGMSDRRVVDDLKKLGSQKLIVKPADWRQPRAVPTLVQMLQHESLPIKRQLIELLDAIPGTEASLALANRAIYDLAPEIRAQAIDALSKRPISEYRSVLLAGLDYPWPAVADHAAEALAALDDQDCIPELVRMLQWPNPSAARMEFVNGQTTYVIREVVTLNHVTNCMICHPPSFERNDLVRGRVPIPGEVRPPSAAYYEDSRGTFVRADTTYLRQDFSVMQRVNERGKWLDQRFDYLVRTRPATHVERSSEMMLQHAKDTTFRQRQAILFALRELYGSNLGTTYDDWLPALELFQTMKRIQVATNSAPQ